MRLTKRFSLVVFLIPLAGGEAAAAVPSPSSSRVPAVVVGNIGGAPIGAGFIVVVRKMSNDPVPGADVQLIFPATGPRPLLEQETGTTMNCATRTMSRLADGNGIAVFHPRIAGFANLPAVDVRADGLLLRSVSARSTDLDGDGTVSLLDFHRFAQNFLRAPAAPETDYDQNGRTDAWDFDLFRREFVARARGVACP